MAEKTIRSLSRSILQSEIAITRLLSFLTTVADPDEMLKKAGIPRYRLRQLELDDEVSQCKDTRVEAVISTPWRIDGAQARACKLLSEIVKPHIDSLVRGSLDARFYGYSVMEMIYEDSGNAITVDRISKKPMEWFAPQRDGSLRYYPDDGTSGDEGIKCDYRKFLLVRVNPTYENPYGEALLSRLWFPITWRREGWGLWLQFLETFGEPIILGQVRSYEEFVEAMEAQGVRSAVGWEGIGSDDKLETVTASTPGEFERLENAIVRRTQKLILGQTLTSDVGSNGSYAVAAIHNEVRNDKRRADMRMVQATGQQLIDVLADLNRIPRQRFVMADDTGLEMARAQRDQVLMPVLHASGMKLKRSYFVANFDYTDSDLEDAPTESSAMAHVDPAKQQSSLNDTGNKKPAVADRSVTGDSP